MNITHDILTSRETIQMLGGQTLIWITMGLKEHFKAKDMTLKQRIKKSINEEFNPVIA